MKTENQFVEDIRDNVLTDDKMQALVRRFKRRANNMKTRMAAYLEYVSRFYNTDNRGVNEGLSIGQCVYSSTPYSPGCAIGQFLPDDVAKECDSRDSSSIGSILRNTDLIKIKWMLDFDKNFLSDIQSLHDCDRCWEESGINEIGLTKISKLYNYILADYYPLTY